MQPSNQLIRELREIYEKIYRKKLTDKEVFEIAKNLLGFFDLLSQFEKNNSKSKPNKNNIGNDV